MKNFSDFVFQRNGDRIYLLSRAGNLFRLRRVGLQSFAAQYQRTGLSAVLRLLGRNRARMGEADYAADEQAV